MKQDNNQWIIPLDEDLIPQEKSSHEDDVAKKATKLMEDLITEEIHKMAAEALISAKYERRVMLALLLAMLIKTVLVIIL